jgi:hypothetical protein
VVVGSRGAEVGSDWVPVKVVVQVGEGRVGEDSRRGVRAGVGGWGVAAWQAEIRPAMTRERHMELLIGKNPPGGTG